MIDNRPTHLEQKVLEGYLLCSNIDTRYVCGTSLYVTTSKKHSRIFFCFKNIKVLPTT